MPRHLIDIQKAQIATKIESRFPSNVVAEEFNVTQRTVQRISKRWQEKGRIHRYLGSGRPKISTAAQDALLCDIIQEHPFETAVNARMISNFPGSSRTARRRLKV
jgi:transposase